MPERTVGARRASGEDTGRDPGGAGPVVSRSSLGGSRALVGGLLVAASAVGLFAAYAGVGGEPDRSYVVAGHDLGAGARLGPGDLAVVPMDLPDGVAGRSFSSPEALAGATLVTPLAEGELVQSSAVVAKASGPSSRELTFSVAGASLARTVEPGERVDVLATYGGPGDAVTVVVASGVLVVDLEGPESRLGDPGSRSVTLALEDPDEALAVAHAIQVGRVTVLRSTGAQTLGNLPPYVAPGPRPSPTGGG